MKTLKIVLVDDNKAFRLALKTILTQQYGAQIIGEASSAAEYWEIHNPQQADVILIDGMIPEIDGISLTKAILWENSKLKIIAITMHVDKVYLNSLIETGFVGCIFKNNLFNQLQPAITAVMKGCHFYPKNINLGLTKNYYNYGYKSI